MLIVLYVNSYACPVCFCALRFKVDPSVSLQDVVERCPPQLTGADMYALCSDAMMSAIKRKIARVTDGTFGPHKWRRVRFPCKCLLKILLKL